MASWVLSTFPWIMSPDGFNPMLPSKLRCRKLKYDRCFPIQISFEIQICNFEGSMICNVLTILFLPPCVKQLQVTIISVCPPATFCLQLSCYGIIMVAHPYNAMRNVMIMESQSPLHITLTSQSPVPGLFTQAFIQVQIKEHIKAPRHWPLCGEFNGDRWTRIKGQ